MKIVINIIVLFIFTGAFGQTKGYSEKEILETQSVTVSKIVSALQNDSVESVLPYFNTNDARLSLKLANYVSKIERLKGFTTFSEVIVFDEGYHIFRCRYSDANRARFQIDFYFQTDNPNSQVIRIKTKSDRVLKREHKKRMVNTKTPPPPKGNGG